MRMMMAVMLVLGQAATACSKSKEDKADPAPAPAVPAVSLPAKAPQLAKVLGKPRPEVHAELGGPIEQEDNEDSFKYGPAKMSVTFGHGAATRLTVGVEGSGVVAADVSRWLGVSGTEATISGRRYRIVTTDEDNFAWLTLDLAELPRRRPPIAELLAGDERSAARLLKGWEKAMEHTFIEREDDLMMLVNFDEKNIPPLVRKGEVRLLQLTFREGVLVDQRRSEILEWLGFQEADGEIMVKRRRFQVSATKLNVTFQRLYTKK